MRDNYTHIILSY